jgi:hypothetical protein
MGHDVIVSGWWMRLHRMPLGTGLPPRTVVVVSVESRGWDREMAVVGRRGSRATKRYVATGTTAARAGCSRPHSEDGHLRSSRACSGARWIQLCQSSDGFGIVPRRGTRAKSPRWCSVQTRLRLFLGLTTGQCLVVWDTQSGDVLEGRRQLPVHAHPPPPTPPTPQPAAAVCHREQRQREHHVPHPGTPALQVLSSPEDDTANNKARPSCYQNTAAACIFTLSDLP